MADPFGVGPRAGIHELADLEAGNAPREDLGPAITTGLQSLDWVLGGAQGGLRAGELVVLGARSGHGKSALAEQIALATSLRHRTTYFALELGRERTTDRLLAKVMRTDEQSAHSALAAGSEVAKKALESLAYERDLRIEQRDLDADFRLDDALAMMIQNSPKVVVFDHLRHFDDWLIPPPEAEIPKGARSDYAPILFSRRLHQVARTYKCAIIAVHQCKNQLQAKRPTQHDLADTAALSQVADHVWMIHRPFRGETQVDTIAEVVVDKNRRGPECLLHFEWTGRLMRYRDLSPDDETPCCKQKPRYGARA